MLPEQDAMLEKLYHEFFYTLLAYVTSIVRNPDRAQDIVQDTFHEAVRHIDYLMTHENPGGWLRVTAKNKIRESERALNRYLRRFLSLDTGLPEGTQLIGNDGVDISGSDTPAPMTLIKQALTAEEFRLLTRFVFDGASHLELAREFGITVYASQKRLERIRKKLYEIFPDRKKLNRSYQI